MNLAFFTNFSEDIRNQAHILLKGSCTLGKLVNTQTKAIKLLCIGKIIPVSVAFLMVLSLHSVSKQCRTSISRCRTRSVGSDLGLHCHGLPV